MARMRGFSLIELVIVVAIVGILASAAMPLARWSLKRRNEYELQQNLRILRNAIDRYHDAAAAGLIEVPEGSTGYPASLDVLVEGVPLLGQMPPVAPGASDEYAASGPGLTGGLAAQLNEGQGGIGATGAGGFGPGTANNTPATIMGGSAMQQNRFGGAQGGLGTQRGSAAGGGLSGTLQRGVQPGLAGGQGGLPFGSQRGQSGFGARPGLQQGGSRIGGQSPFGFGTTGPGMNAAGVDAPLGPDGQPLKLMFLRRIPIDPFTGKAEWGMRCYGEPPTDRLWCGKDVFDVYSKSLADAIDGTHYRDW